jgi:hypothetical protein
MPCGIAVAGKKKAQEKIPAPAIFGNENDLVTVAAATVAARTFPQFIGQGDPAEFDGLGDGALDRLLDLMHFFLGVQKAGGHGILQKGIPLALKSGDFGSVQGLSMMLLLLEGLPFAHQRFVLAPRTVVSHKSIDALADTRGLHLFEDGLTQFIRLGFKFRRHKLCEENIMPAAVCKLLPG